MKRWIKEHGIPDSTISIIKRRYWGGVFRVRCSNANFVCKTGGNKYDSDAEAEMLRRLHSAGLPVPKPLHAEAGLLVLEGLPVGPADATCVYTAGKLIGHLHRTSSAECYGYPITNSFGVLLLNNAWRTKWKDFFIEARLLAFAEEAERRGHLCVSARRDIDRAVNRIQRLLQEPNHPSLLHGDVWSNNILSVGGAPLFLDPVCLYGDPDYELAFIVSYLDMRLSALKGYEQEMSVSSEFWAIKLPIYRLSHSLAHLALFGGPFLSSTKKQLDAILSM